MLKSIEQRHRRSGMDAIEAHARSGRSMLSLALDARGRRMPVLSLLYARSAKRITQEVGKALQQLTDAGDASRRP
jgi:hypothetical protein